MCRRPTPSPRYHEFKEHHIAATTATWHPKIMCPRLVQRSLVYEETMAELLLEALPEIVTP